MRPTETIDDRFPPASLGRSKRSSILPGRPRPMKRRPGSSPTMFFPKPLQLTNEAQVRVHRRNGVVTAKLENETRSDHRTIVLLQIQEASGSCGLLVYPYRISLAVLSSAANPPLQAAILAPARDLRQLLRR